MRKPSIPLSAETIRRLRSETGFPMMECKSVLLECDGDYLAARKVLLEQRGKPPEQTSDE